MSPAGAAAERLAVLGWWLLGAASAVSLIVVVLVLAPLRHRRAALRETALVDGGGTRFIAFGSIASVAVLIGAFVATLYTLRAASEPPGPPALTIDVVGRQWWWEILYPDSVSGAVVTANEIHVPVGRPVRLRFESPDVIHSFWVPELAGKTDLVPGQTNVFWLQADRPGRYRGQCAEYCGRQHAHMALYVVADTPDDFASWLDRERRPAAEPTAEIARQGRQLVAVGAGCGLCHAVRGVSGGPLGPHPGPDLTHLASRRTIGAGTLANTPENLAAWIRDPSRFKPGTQMPAFDLDAPTLRAILAYLQTLN